MIYLVCNNCNRPYNADKGVCPCQMFATTAPKEPERVELFVVMWRDRESPADLWCTTSPKTREMADIFVRQGKEKGHATRLVKLLGEVVTDD